MWIIWMCTLITWMCTLIIWICTLIIWMCTSGHAYTIYITSLIILSLDLSSSSVCFARLCTVKSIFFNVSTGLSDASLTYSSRQLPSAASSSKWLWKQKFQATNKKFQIFGLGEEKVIFDQLNKPCFSLFCVVVWRAPSSYGCTWEVGWARKQTTLCNTYLLLTTSHAVLKKRRYYPRFCKRMSSKTKIEIWVHGQQNTKRWEKPNKWVACAQSRREASAFYTCISALIPSLQSLASFPVSAPQPL